MHAALDSAEQFSSVRKLKIPSSFEKSAEKSSLMGSDEMIRSANANGNNKAAEQYSMIEQ